MRAGECVIFKRVRRCGARIAHAFLEPASRCSIAALLATLLALIANTRACGSVQPSRFCHAAELPVVQPMGERHNTSRLLFVRAQVDSFISPLGA